MPPSTWRSPTGIATTIALVVSVFHFGWSGVRLPLDHPNLAKFYEHATPLREHLTTGAPVHSVHPAQYGPVFLFVMHPLLAAQRDEWTLALWLYAIQLVCMAAAFTLTAAALFRVSPAGQRSPTLVVAWVAVLWLNFTPLYTVIAMKSVETWELFLITLGLYAHIRNWRWTAGIALAAGGLVKVLPFAFLYYWMVTNRRTFVYAALAVIAFLAVGQALYGSEMGFGYLPRVVAAASGSSYGLDWHENISLKAALAKIFGVLPQPTDDAARTSGYFVMLTGWRRAAAVLLGDAAVGLGFAWLTWTWLRAHHDRSCQRVAWEWSLLTVMLLILSPNTVFEYLTIALGAASYALVRLTAPGGAPNKLGPYGLGRRGAAWCAFLIGLLLMGGIVPRQLLNRLFLVEALNRWTGHTHLMPSEAYQYYCFPLAGLLLLALTIWLLQPPLHDVRSASTGELLR